MSYCQLITFANSKPAEAIEYQNAWGGAARVWDALFNRYLKDPANPYHSWMTGDADKLWALARNSELPMFERAVHTATFDWAIIKREHFAQFAADLRAFVETYPPNGRVCHLLAWAAFVETCTVEAIGFHSTSVASNLWYDWNNERDESVPYNLNSGIKHFEVYERLAKGTKC